MQSVEQEERPGRGRRVAGGKARALLLGLLSLASALLLCELAMRFVVLPNPALAWRPLPPFGRLVTPEQRAWLAGTERELAERREPAGYSRFDPILGWTHRPSSASADGRVHIDARGLRRTRAAPAPSSASAARVAVCGESFTFGEEVSDADAWPAQLEARNPAFELLNYGVGGYGTDQALLRMRREAQAPLHALIVGLMLENIGRNVNRYRPMWSGVALPAAKPRYVLRGDALELLPLPFASRTDFVRAVHSGEVFARLAEHEHWSDPHVPRWLTWSALARFAGSRRAHAARQLEVLWRDVEGDPFRHTLALLEAFRPLARELGTERLLVLVFPTREALTGFAASGERYWSTLLEALDARGLAWLDTSEPLAEAARSAGGVAPLFLESHFSPLGNQVVAESVGRWLDRSEPRSGPR